MPEAGAYHEQAPVPPRPAADAVRRSLRRGIALSLTVHLCLILSSLHRPLSSVPPQEREEVVTVYLSPPPKPRETAPKAAPPSDVSAKPPAPLVPTEAKYLSERDAQVIEEQIRRGTGANSGGAPTSRSAEEPSQIPPPTLPPTPPQSPPQPPPAPQPTKAARATRAQTGGQRAGQQNRQTAAPLGPKPPSSNPPPPQPVGPNPQGATTVKSLYLKPGEFRQLPSPPPSRPAQQTAAREATEQATEELRRRKLNEYRPFSSAGGLAALQPRGGAPDLLPGIREGELTLLNAKADKFAVFVRRVGVQVFTALRRNSWQQVPAAEILRMSDFVTVHATMSATGEVVAVEVKSSSGSGVFDRMVVTSAREGTWDRNPPAAAASSDGKIHFVFMARTWSQFAPNTPVERRWLLLSVGLL